MQQRLVLPGPRLFSLVFRERIDARYEHAALAAGPQSDIHFIEPAGSGVHRQQMHDALREADKEDLVIDRASPVGLLALAARVVEKHEIQIGGVTELHAAQLAVTGRSIRTSRRPAPSSHMGVPYCAVICCQLSCIARSTISSAISVRRSLTRMTGSRPVRSATATRKIAAR